MAQVNWTAEAIDDLEAVGAYIGEVSLLSAQRMQLRIQAAPASLAVFPDRGRRAARGRRVLVIVPPYLIVYRVDDEAVSILQVRHGRRRPRR